MKREIKMFIGCVLLILLDQVTKLLALQNLKGQNPVTLIPDVFQLLYVENRGAAFGILQNRQWGVPHHHGDRSGGACLGAAEDSAGETFPAPHPLSVFYRSRCGGKYDRPDFPWICG